MFLLLASAAVLLATSQSFGFPQTGTFSFFSFGFLGPHLQHIEVAGLGVESELQPPAYATATAMPDPSRSCELHHSSWQHWILNPLSEGRDQTHILMVISQVHYH